MRQIQNFSIHAYLRAQQRAIPPFISNCLVQFGAAAHAHDNCRIYYLDHRALHRAQQVLPKSDYLELEKKRHCYLVLSETDGTIVTQGHRYQRIRH